MVTDLRRFALVLALALPFATAFAGDVSWTGLSTGIWNVPGNWSGGAVPDPADNVTVLGANVTVDDERVVNGAFTLGDDASITVSTEAGSLIVNGSAQIDNGRVQAAAGGFLSLPTVTSWSWTLCINARTLISVAAGGIVDLPALTSLDLSAESCGNNYFVAILATTTGVINMPALETITTASGQDFNLSVFLNATVDVTSLETMESVNLLVDGMSEIAFPALASMSGGTLSANIAGSISAPVLTEATGVFFSPGGPDTLSLPSLETVTNSTLAIPNDSTLVLPALESTLNTNISLSPGSIFDAPELSAIESTTGMNIILSSGDVTISVPKLDSMRNVIVSAAQGAMLDLSSLRTYTWDVCFASAIFTTGSAGSLIDVSGLQTLNINLPNCDVTGFPSTAIQGSMIDFSSLRTISITGGNHVVTFFASDPGTVIDLSQLRTFPVLLVTFFEQNGGVILRFTGGGNGDGNPACGEDAAAAMRGASSRGNLATVLLTMAILALSPALRRVPRRQSA